ncbi:MAG: helix-turn-helix transcriptional regulator [Rhodoblastus sp.]|nr:helix-turn-helix transcriptional regulator [Rhodoblastus sp.]
MNAEEQLSLIDTHVGNRIKLRRSFLRISQEKLGDHLGVSFQQIQKYEKGANRIGAGQLFQIGRLLNVEPSYFFEGLPATKATDSGFSERQSDMPSAGIEDTTDGIALNRAFARIKSSKLRRRLIDLVTAIADSDRS